MTRRTRSRNTHQPSRGIETMFDGTHAPSAGVGIPINPVAGLKHNLNAGKHLIENRRNTHQPSRGIETLRL